MFNSTLHFNRKVVDQSLDFDKQWENVAMLAGSVLNSTKKLPRLRSHREKWPIWSIFIEVKI